MILLDIIILSHAGKKGRMKKMTKIININEYKKRKQHETDTSKLTEMREALITREPWTTMEERAEFMIELSRLSVLEESV